LLLLTLLGIAVQLLLRFPLLACVVTQRHAQLLEPGGDGASIGIAERGRALLRR
jgi:hypothetical protein